MSERDGGPRGGAAARQPVPTTGMEGLGGARCSPPQLAPPSPPIMETPRPQPPSRLGLSHGPPAPRPRAGDSPMALAGGGAVAAAADAGLRLAAAPSLPQPRRQEQQRAGRPLLPARLPPANPAAAAAILKRPPRRFRRGATALPHSAYARPLWRPHGLSGSERLRSPPPAAAAAPPSPSPPPPRSSHAVSLLARLPEHAAGGFRLGPSARREAPPRSPRPCPRPAPLPARELTVTSSRSVSEKKGTARRPFWNRARSGARKPHGGRGALPDTKMSAGCDRAGEAVTTPPPFAGAILGAPLVRAGLAEPSERCGALRSLRPPAYAVGVREAGRKAGRGAGGPAATPGLSVGRGRWGEVPPAALSPRAGGQSGRSSLLLLRPVEGAPPRRGSGVPAPE